MRLRPALATLAVLALASPLLPSASAAVEEGIGSPSLTAVANLVYPKVNGSSAANQGTDIEFATIKGVDYALAGTYENGLQIVDISDPAKPVIAGKYDCGMSQGDVQTFVRTVDGKARTFVSYTQDDGYTARANSKCLKEAKGFAVKPDAEALGTFIADITDVKNPVTVSYVKFDKGSHNHTVDPSGSYLYNSNSDLITGVASNSIEIYDIRDFAAPKRLPDLDLPPVPTGLGADSHDITFSADGKRAYSAALSQTAVINTENAGAPRLISTIVDPTINVVHQADPVRLKDKTTGTERDFLVIEDELAGAIGTGQCPNGGVHVYDVTGQLEAAPVKVGYWNIDEVRKTTDLPLGAGCTAHVFDLDAKTATMTIAYYNGGVRVVDLSGLVGVALGGNGVGMKQIGFRRFTNSNTWAAKTNAYEADGSFFLYGNDQNRGLDVYRFDRKKAAAASSASDGVWMGAEEAAKVLGARGQLDLTGYEMYCLPAKASSELAPAAEALQAAHHG